MFFYPPSRLAVRAPWFAGCGVSGALPPRPSHARVLIGKAGLGAGLALALAPALLLPCSVGHAQDPDSISIRSVTVTNGQVRLDWEGGTPPYRVQYCNANGYGWLDISDYIFGRSYSGPAPGDYACLRVRSAPDFIAPSAPEGLLLYAVRCDRVALGWRQARDDADGTGVLGYRLYRDGVLAIEMADPSTFFLDRHVVPETTYRYTVTAFDLLGNESPPSAPLLATTPVCTAESGSGASVKLVWDPSEERQVEGYLVYWGVRPGEYLYAMDAMDDTGLIIPGLRPGVTYFFSVTAYDRDGEQSDYSFETAYITPDPSAPSASSEPPPPAQP